MRSEDSFVNFFESNMLQYSTFLDGSEGVHTGCISHNFLAFFIFYVLEYKCEGNDSNY